MKKKKKYVDLNLEHKMWVWYWDVRFKEEPIEPNMRALYKYYDDKLHERFQLPEKYQRLNFDLYETKNSTT